jgi:hypothetical protein
VAEFTVSPAATFEASYGAGTAGLVGTVEVAIMDQDGATVFGPTSAGIIENIVDGVPTGVYTAELTAPVPLGQYGVIWSNDGLWDAVNVSPADQLIVTIGGPATPILPDGPGANLDGPCSLWATEDDIAACCTVEGTDLSILTQYAVAASQVMYAISGKRYAGLCGPVTARPCRTGCGCWPFQRLSSGYNSHELTIWTGSVWGLSGPGWSSTCGCGCVPEVVLSGVPVAEIGEVKINGSVVDPTTYELRDYRKLVRTDGGFWPSCQNIALPDTEAGTWSVTYTYGEGPPVVGQLAAAALACEMYTACSDGAGECQLPSQATRIIRQGITIENLQPLAMMLVGGSTGIVAIDAFIASLGPLVRRPAFLVPGQQRYARITG